MTLETFFRNKHSNSLRTLTVVAIICLASASLVRADGDEARGLIVPFEDVVISANARKLIVKVHVAEGDTVGEGSVLAELDPTFERLEVRRLEKVLQSREFDNNAGQKLLKRSMISKEEALDRQLEYEIAQLQLEVAQANLERCSITTPLRGIVVQRLKDPGESTTESEPMFQIVDTEQVFAQIYLPRKRSSALDEGQEIDVTIAADGSETWVASGSVSFVSPIIDGSSGLRRCKVLIDNRDGRIQAGMRATVTLDD